MRAENLAVSLDYAEPSVQTAIDRRTQTRGSEATGDRSVCRKHPRHTGGEDWQQQDAACQQQGHSQITANGQIRNGRNRAGRNAGKQDEQTQQGLTMTFKQRRLVTCDNLQMIDLAALQRLPVREIPQHEANGLVEISFG